MKLENGTIDLRNTALGHVFLVFIALTFVFGVYLLVNGLFSLIEREAIDDRMAVEGKALTGEIVRYEQRKIGRRGHLYWVPIIRVTDSISPIEIPDQYRFFVLKPTINLMPRETVALEFLAPMSVVRSRESYRAAKTSLIRDDIISCLLGFASASLLPLLWFKRRVADSPK
jgi:hypothetical protein